MLIICLDFFTLMDLKQYQGRKWEDNKIIPFGNEITFDTLLLLKNLCVFVVHSFALGSDVTLKKRIW